MPDIQAALGFTGDEFADERGLLDNDQAAPGNLWDPARGEVAGGMNRGEAVERQLAGREEHDQDADIQEES